MSDEKIVYRDCINWSNNDHCAKTKCNYCVKDCKHYRVCGTSPTTPSYVASQLTDEEIETLATEAMNESFKSKFLYCSRFKRAAAVLRDYVRLRRMANAVEDAFVKFAVEYEYRIIENADTRAMGREELANDENWQALKRLLAEAEKG